MNITFHDFNGRTPLPVETMPLSCFIAATLEALIYNPDEIARMVAEFVTTGRHEPTLPGRSGILTYIELVQRHK